MSVCICRLCYDNLLLSLLETVINSETSVILQDMNNRQWHSHTAKPEVAIVKLRPVQDGMSFVKILHTLNMCDDLL